jgi:glycosyltransferase involved in cell wall biosynthesis
LNLPKLDIVLPCYNPANNWVNAIIESYHDLSKLLPQTAIKIILVNDGSTKQIAESDINQLQQHLVNFQYIHYQVNRGKGYALRKGVAAADAPICLYTDVDFPYTTNSIMALLQQLTSAQFDIAAGVKNKNYYKHVPPFRRFISKLLRACTGFVLRLKVADTQCGLKGFNEKGKELFLSTTIDRYLFDLEFIFLASKNKQVTITPVPIELNENVHFSSMRLGILFTEAKNFITIFFKNFK